MIKCIAIDDEPLALEVIASYVEQIDHFQMLQSFLSAQKAKVYLSSFPVDLIFLDIQMPGLNGVDFFKSLKSKPLVIFTTAFSQFALDGFDVDAIDYLLKPIEFDRFQRACDKASTNINNRAKNASFAKGHFFVRSDYQLVKIEFSDIEYIEGMDDYVKIFLNKSRPIYTLMAMKDLITKLPENKFIRVHRSFIVPIGSITSFNSRNVFLHNKALPIGDTYRKKVKELLG